MATPIDKYLSVLAEKNGSYLYLTTGAPPCAKFASSLTPLSQVLYKAGEVEQIAFQIMDDEQKQAFRRDLEMNLAVSIPGVGRFRINIFRQRNECCIAAHNVKTDVPTLEKLGLPEQLGTLALSGKGIVVLAGGPGTGCSSTFASLIDHRNEHKAEHILTIEDPVEYAHTHKLSMVNQREVGVDARSFHSALENILSQGPDSIGISELRDCQTLLHALDLAEAGKFVLVGLQAESVREALEALKTFMPTDKAVYVSHNLARHLLAVISQKLEPTVDGGRAPVLELLIPTDEVRQALEKGNTEMVRQLYSAGLNNGSITLEESLARATLQQ